MNRLICTNLTAGKIENDFDGIAFNRRDGAWVGEVHFWNGGALFGIFDERGLVLLRDQINELLGEHNAEEEQAGAEAT